MTAFSKLGGEPLAKRAVLDEMSGRLLAGFFQKNDTPFPFLKKSATFAKNNRLKYKTMKTKNEVEQPKRMNKFGEWRAAQTGPIIEVLDWRAVNR